MRFSYKKGLALAGWLRLPSSSDVASFAEAAACKPGQGAPSKPSPLESEYIIAILAPALEAGQFAKRLRAAA